MLAHNRATILRRSIRLYALSSSSPLSSLSVAMVSPPMPSSSSTTWRWAPRTERRSLAYTTEPSARAAMLPREVVAELDRHIVGQKEAKRAMAIALRNRWRRHRLTPDLQEEVMPKNILMIGPTGVGKTEIVRRIAKILDAPFIKVEATKFTEVGFHGRDVDHIIRDLVDFAITQTRENLRKQYAASIKDIVDRRIVELLVGEDADQTAQTFMRLLQDGALEDRKIEIPAADAPRIASLTASAGPLNLGDLMAVIQPPRSSKPRAMKIKDARPILEDAEMQRLLNNDTVIQEAIKAVEEDGIVFIDEIDKICATERSYGSGASDEGVQKDLLPLIEGCVINTKHGNIRTDHILFIASGAFLSCKPSDLLAELQGRLPIRVELMPLTKQDLHRILSEPQHNLLIQTKALLRTEGVDCVFTDDAIEEIATVAFDVNEEVENIGARRLHSVIERTIEKISFVAPELASRFQVTPPLVNKSESNSTEAIDTPETHTPSQDTSHDTTTSSTLSLEEDATVQSTTSTPQSTEPEQPQQPKQANSELQVQRIEDCDFTVAMTEEGLLRFVIDRKYVQEQVGSLLKRSDLQKFIL